MGEALGFYSLYQSTSDEFSAKGVSFSAALRDVIERPPQLSEFASLELWTVCLDKYDSDCDKYDPQPSQRSYQLDNRKIDNHHWG